MTETSVEYTTFQRTGPAVIITTPDPDFFAVALDVHRHDLNPSTAADRCASICAERVRAAQKGMVGDEPENVVVMAAEMDVLHAARRLAQAYRAAETGDVTALCELSRREKLLAAAVDVLEAQEAF